MASKTNEQTIAVIDLGSNSARLVVAKINANHEIKILDRHRVVLGLAAQLDDNSFLSQDAISSTLETLREMHSIAAPYKCSIRAVATSAARHAKNFGEVIRPARQIFGIDVNIIDGLEEARLAWLGVNSHFNLAKDTSLIIDIGGGSTEVVVSEKGDIKFSTSLHIGGLSLTKQFLEWEGKSSRQQIISLKSYIETRVEPLKEQMDANRITRGFLTSGIAKAIGLGAHKESYGDSLNQINGYNVEVTTLYSLAKKAEMKTPAEMCKQWGIEEDRSHLFLAGIAIVEAFSRICQFDQWTISRPGIREGLLIQTYQESHSDSPGKDLYEALRSKILDWHIDQTYCKQVAELACQLYKAFNQLQLSPIDDDEFEEYGRILQAAALLHEAGKFVSYKSYHKHSFYLIANSHLKGIANRDRILIALVARHQRKRFFSLIRNKVSAVDQMIYPEDEIKINYLACCLRLAKAMNRTRQSLINSVEVERGKGKSAILTFHHNRDVQDFHVELGQVRNELGDFLIQTGIELILEEDL